MTLHVVGVKCAGCSWELLGSFGKCLHLGTCCECDLEEWQTW